MWLCDPARPISGRCAFSPRGREGRGAVRLVRQGCYGDRTLPFMRQDVVERKETEVSDESETVRTVQDAR